MLLCSTCELFTSVSALACATHISMKKRGEWKREREKKAFSEDLQIFYLHKTCCCLHSERHTTHGDGGWDEEKWESETLFCCFFSNVSQHKRRVSLLLTSFFSFSSLVGFFMPSPPFLASFLLSCLSLRWGDGREANERKSKSLTLIQLLPPLVGLKLMFEHNIEKSRRKDGLKSEWISTFISSRKKSRMFARKTNKTKENEARSRSISNWININIYLSWRVAALSLLCVRWLLHACSSPFSCFDVFSPKRQWCVWNDGGKIRHIVKILPWLCKLNFISTFFWNENTLENIPRITGKSIQESLKNSSSGRGQKLMSFSDVMDEALPSTQHRTWQKEGGQKKGPKKLTLDINLFLCYKLRRRERREFVPKSTWPLIIMWISKYLLDIRTVTSSGKHFKHSQHTENCVFPPRKPSIPPPDIVSLASSWPSRALCVFSIFGWLSAERNSIPFHLIVEMCVQWCLLPRTAQQSDDVSCTSWKDSTSL